MILSSTLAYGLGSAMHCFISTHNTKPGMDLTDEMANLFFGTCCVICENSIDIEVSISISMKIAKLTV